MTLIIRTAMIDDNGTGETGTVLNNDWKQELYNQIDQLAAGVSGSTGDVFKNVANVFTQDQTIDKLRPALVLHQTGNTAKHRLQSATGVDVFLTRNLAYDGANWNLDDTTLTGAVVGHNNIGQLAFYTATAGANPRSLTSVFLVDSVGNTTIAGSLTVTGKVADASLSANVALKNINNSFSVAQTMQGLTVPAGTVTITPTLNCQALIAATSIQSGSYMYPGAITAPGTIQSSWYLAGHSSYGLYINTGLYVAGTIWTAATLSVAGTASTGALTVQGTITANAGHVMCGYYLYPGYSNGSAVIQSNYFLSAHTTWGLYTNTSMYFEGGIYPASVTSRGAIYEYGRGTGQGGAIGWVPAVYDLEGRVVGGSLQCYYYLVGKMLFWTIYGAPVTLPAASAEIRFSVPIAPLYPNAQQTAVRIYNPAGGDRGGYAHVDGSWIWFVPNDSGWAAGTGYALGQGFYSIA